MSTRADFEKKYEFIDNLPINFGGFGSVFKIRDRKVKTEYVLKVMKKKDPKNPNLNSILLESFEKEINFLKNVKGANIINIIDFYNDSKNDSHLIILEKMDGDLDYLLKAQYPKGMSSIMIRKIFSQLNSAFRKMNKAGITHMDLKPSNILYSYLNDEKTDFIIKLGDFGLSTNLISTKTKSDTAGTNLFMAPEIENFKYGNKCDLYSIGIILFMLKTGEYIFDGKNLLQQLLNKQKNLIKKEIKDDEQLNDLIKKLVVINPKERLNWENYYNHPFFKVNDDIIPLKKEIEKLVTENEKLKNSYKKNKYVNVDYKGLEIYIYIDENESEKTLKNKIYDVMGIHPSFQYLSGGPFMDPYLQYSSSEPYENGELIWLKTYIYIKTDSGVWAGMDVGSSDDIYDIKEKIFQILRIPIHRQILKFGYIELKDKNNLLFKYIKKNENELFKIEDNFIHVSFKKEENISVNISIGDKIEKFNIDNLETIENLYSLIEKKINRKIDYYNEALLFGNEYLYKNDSSFLAQKGFEENKIYDIILIKLKCYFIFVKKLTGETIEIKCNSCETIEKIKEKIYNETGIPVDRQRLIFEGKQLDDNRSLYDYHIEPNSVLLLIFRLF